VGGAGLVALVAVDASGLIASDFDWAEDGDETHEGAVRAEESAPHVLDHHGEEDQGEDDGDADDGHVAEEVEHLDVGDDAERSEEELLEAVGVEGGDDVEEEGEEDVLEAAEGDIEPAGKDEAAVEELLAEVPEVFGGGTYGAEPGAKGFLEEPARDEKDDEEDHRGGVDSGDVVGGEEVLEVHEAGDGKPAFDAGGATEVMGLAIGFVIADPEVELEAEPGVEGEEGELDRMAGTLGVVEEMAADEGLFGDGGCGGGTGEGGHGLPSTADCRGKRRAAI